jgi:hypothetical protein
VIVHVTDCFHPRLGGIEVQVEELARAQQENQETVHVITATPAGRGTDRPDHSYPVHRVAASLPWELPVHPERAYTCTGSSPAYAPTWYMSMSDPCPRLPGRPCTAHCAADSPRW